MFWISGARRLKYIAWRTAMFLVADLRLEAVGAEPLDDGRRPRWGTAACPSPGRTAGSRPSARSAGRSSARPARPRCPGRRSGSARPAPGCSAVPPARTTASRNWRSCQSSRNSSTVSFLRRRLPEIRDLPFDQRLLRIGLELPVERRLRRSIEHLGPTCPRRPGRYRRDRASTASPRARRLRPGEPKKKEGASGRIRTPRAEPDYRKQAQHPLRRLVGRSTAPWSPSCVLHRGMQSLELGALPPPFWRRSSS